MKMKVITPLRFMPCISHSFMSPERLFPRDVAVCSAIGNGKELTESFNALVNNAKEATESPSSAFPSSVQIISLSPFTKASRHTDDERDNVLKSIENAVVNVGFFLVSEHGISSDLIDQAHEEALRFFKETNSEEKEKLVKEKNGTKLWRGYTNNESISSFNGRKKESEPVEKYTIGRIDNVWPKATDDAFRILFQRYYLELGVLSQRILELLERIMEVETGTVENIIGGELSSGFLRLAHYRPQETVKVVAGGHTDMGSLTIVSATAQGYELLVDGSWEPIPYVSPQVLIVNIGDLLHVLTNGRWKSAVHRVRSSAGHSTSRSSLIYFAGTGIELEEEPGEKEVLIQPLRKFEQEDQSAVINGPLDFKAFIRSKRGKLL